HRAGADGGQTRHGQRGVRAAGEGHYRRAHGFGGPDRLHRSGCIPAGLSEGAMRRFTARLVQGSLLLLFLAAPAAAQDTQPLTLQQAEQIALQNHPLIQAAQLGAQAAREAVRETRAPYFPTAFGSVTGAEAEAGIRIAAGGLNNPIIYDRLATGVAIAQLLTDFGRTHALV